MVPLLQKLLHLRGLDMERTVDRICRRVITAIPRSNLRIENVKWPTGEAKEIAKDWVEKKSSTSSGLEKWVLHG